MRLIDLAEVLALAGQDARAELDRALARCERPFGRSVCQT
jgi:hypothetical protein